jgi:hypothetical protein
MSADIVQLLTCAASLAESNHKEEIANVCKIAAEEITKLRRIGAKVVRKHDGGVLAKESRDSVVIEELRAAIPRQMTASVEVKDW